MKERVHTSGTKAFQWLSSSSVDIQLGLSNILRYNYICC